jgi:hypothetical protein
VITLGIDPIEHDTWKANPLSIVSADINFTRRPPADQQAPSGRDKVRSRTNQSTTRIERLGYALGWTGNVMAALALMIAAFLSMQMVQQSDRIFIAVIGFVVAAILFGIGRAFRYILAGE